MTFNLSEFFVHVLHSPVIAHQTVAATLYHLSPVYHAHRILPTGLSSFIPLLVALSAVDAHPSTKIPSLDAYSAPTFVRSQIWHQERIPIRKEIND
jgi:hypothetical protein